MKKFLFSVYDDKARIYCNPFVHVNRASAERDFLHACQDPSSELSKFPTDYTLVELGGYDDITGVIEAHAQPTTITKGNK